MAIKYENPEQNGDENITINSDEPEVTRGSRWFQTFPSQPMLNVILVILLIPVLVLVVLLVMREQTHASSEPIIPAPLHAERNEQQSATPAGYPIDPNVTVTLPAKLKIVSRRDWLAKPREEEATPLELPVPYVIIMHTAQENCSNQTMCAFHVRQVQSFHMSHRQWDDIGYSFLIGGDGNAYEGRGWKSVGAQVLGYNAKCIGIAFIGTFNQIMPPDRQIVAAKELIELGVKQGYIAKDYKLLAARQLQTTQSPGLLLYEDVKKWPHWCPTP